MTKTAPMKLVQTFVCGPVRVAIAYTPATDVSFLMGHVAGDSFRDRFEIRLENAAPSVGTPFRYVTPQPLQFFFTVLRKQKDGALKDVTAPQIDSRHTGPPGSSDFVFAQPDETWTDRVSYRALATILASSDIIPGEYVVRLRSYDMITADGTAHPSEPVEMPLTVRSVRDP